MDWIRGWVTRISAMLRGRRHEAELREEIALHIEMEAEAGVRRGLSREAALREARVRFGGVERFTEATREVRHARWLDALRRDIRFATRLTRKDRSFSAAVVGTFALGIGVTTAVFSVIHVVLLKDSPFADPDRLVMVWETDRASDTHHEPASWPDVADFRARSRSVTDLGSVVGWESTLAAKGAEPERVRGLGVTTNLPALLGVRPLMGRAFAQEDGVAGGALAVMLSEPFWRTRFNASPSAIGAQITLNELPATIVGVLPRDADLGIAQVHARADYSAPFTGDHVDMWIAMNPTAESYPRTMHPFLTLGRLAPGATVKSAQTELSRIAADLERTYPENAARGVNVEPYSEVVFAGVRRPLTLMFGAAVLVLLVAIVNITNLLLARMTTRVREVAIRRTMGASTRRLSAQFLIENLLLTLVGTAAGVGVAALALGALARIAPAGVPRLDAVRIDLPVLLLAAACAGVVALFFGLLPSLHARRVDLQETLKNQAGRGTSESARGLRLRSGLVVAEIALTVALAAGAGLLVRSFLQLRGVDPGFRAQHVLKAEFQLPGARYPVDYSRFPLAPEITRFRSEVLARVRALPGVTSASIAYPHPLNAGFTNSFAIAGREAESADFPEIRTRFVTDDYLNTVGVPLRSGRMISAGDAANAPNVLVVNQAAAQRYFPGANPIGQVIQFWGVSWRIVGVIGNERFEGVEKPAEPAVYGSLEQAPMQSGSLLVRADGDPAALAAAVRGVVREVDPQLALYGVETLQAALDDTIARPRFSAALLLAFACVALLLAIIGVHGVLGYTIAQRRAELGIRMALGATSANVRLLVVRQGMRLAAAGTGLGLATAFALSRLVRGLVFQISPFDPPTFAGVAAAVLGTAAIVTLLQAGRAARSSPMEALRAD